MASNGVLNFVIRKDKNCFFTGLPHFQPVIRLASSGDASNPQTLDLDFCGTPGRIHRFALLRWRNGNEHSAAIPSQSRNEDCGLKITTSVWRCRKAVVVQREG